MAVINKGKRLLFAVLATAVLLLAADRTLAYLYQPKADAKAVIIYTTARCPYCKLLRKDLKVLKIPYQERDIEKSLDGMFGFWALKAHGVPVSAIGPDVIYGYQKERIFRSLSKLGYQIDLKSALNPLKENIK